MRNAKFLTCCVLFLAMFVSGCDSHFIKTEPVSGVVFYDGQPLENCAVNFSPVENESGEPAYAITDENGRFKLQTLRGKPDGGTTKADYIVTFAKYKMVKTGRKERLDDGTIAYEEDAVTTLPKNYEDRKKSPYKITVNAGKNTFEFSLKSDGSGPVTP